MKVLIFDIFLTLFIQGHEESTLSNGQDQPGTGVWTDYSGPRYGRAPSENNPEGHHDTTQGQFPSPRSCQLEVFARLFLNALSCFQCVCGTEESMHYSFVMEQIECNEVI